MRYLLSLVMALALTFAVAQERPTINTGGPSTSASNFVRPFTIFPQPGKLLIKGKTLDVGPDTWTENGYGFIPVLFEVNFNLVDLISQNSDAGNVAVANAESVFPPDNAFLFDGI